MLLSEKSVRCPGSAWGRGRNEGAAVSRWGTAVVVVEMVRGCCRYAMWPWVMVVAVMSQEAVMGACMVRGNGDVRGQCYMGRWADGRLRGVLAVVGCWGWVVTGGTMDGLKGMW